jgi:hypothetical protein
METEPKAMSREQREKAINNKIARKHRQRRRLEILAQEKQGEIDTLYETLRDLAADRVAELDKEIGNAASR